MEDAEEEESTSSSTGSTSGAVNTDNNFKTSAKRGRASEDAAGESSEIRSRRRRSLISTSLQSSTGDVQAVSNGTSPALSPSTTRRVAADAAPVPDHTLSASVPSRSITGPTPGPLQYLTVPLNYNVQGTSTVPIFSTLPHLQVQGPLSNFGITNIIPFTAVPNAPAASPAAASSNPYNLLAPANLFSPAFQNPTWPAAFAGLYPAQNLHGDGINSARAPNSLAADSRFGQTAPNPIRADGRSSGMAVLPLSVHQSVMLIHQGQNMFGQSTNLPPSFAGIVPFMTSSSFHPGPLASGISSEVSQSETRDHDVASSGRMEILHRSGLTTSTGTNAQAPIQASGTNVPQLSGYHGHAQHSPQAANEVLRSLASSLLSQPRAAIPNLPGMTGQDQVQQSSLANTLAALLSVGNGATTNSLPGATGVTPVRPNMSIMQNHYSSIHAPAAAIPNEAGIHPPAFPQLHHGTSILGNSQLRIPLTAALDTQRPDLIASADPVTAIFPREINANNEGVAMNQSDDDESSSSSESHADKPAAAKTSSDDDDASSSSSNRSNSSATNSRTSCSTSTFNRAERESDDPISRPLDLDGTAYGINSSRQPDLPVSFSNAFLDRNAIDATQGLTGMRPRQLTTNREGDGQLNSGLDPSNLAAARTDQRDDGAAIPNTATPNSAQSIPPAVGPPIAEQRGEVSVGQFPPWMHGNAGDSERSFPLCTDSEEDLKRVSAFQRLARQQIEVFEATRKEAATSMQGRNIPVFPGKVGIRCRHCTDVPRGYRKAGSMYYPSKVSAYYLKSAQWPLPVIKCLVAENLQRDFDCDV